MNPFRHYPNSSGGEGGSGGDKPAEQEITIRRSSGEVIHRDERHYRQRAEDRTMDAMMQHIEHIRDTPLTLRRITLLFGLFLAVNQAVNWWRDKNVDPKQFQELKVTVGALAANVDTLTNQFRSDRQGNNFIFYSICVQMLEQRPNRYPRFCERSEIQQFNPSR